MDMMSTSNAVEFTIDGPIPAGGGIASHPLALLKLELNTDLVGLMVWEMI